jgi:hypothetical protein
MRERSALLLALLLPGCVNGQGESRCGVCREPDEAIIIEPGAARVSSVLFSGTACAKAYLHTAPPDGGDGSWDAAALPGAYIISPLSEGRCEVVVQLADGTTLRQAFELNMARECCSGLYATDGARWRLQSAESAVADGG